MADAGATQQPGMARPDDEPQHWLGREPGLYRPEMQRPAKDIEVARFRQILIWPLALHLEEGEAGREADEAERPARRALRKLRCGLLPGTPWVVEDNPMNHLPQQQSAYANAGNRAYHAAEADKAQRYSEFVYFHDHVQRVLFGGGDLSPFTLHRRSDIKFAEFDIVLDARSAPPCIGLFRARVERCNLYVFNAGTAVIALEIDFGEAPQVFNPDALPWNTPRSMTLADVQTFADHARRAYAPFYNVNDKTAASRPMRAPLAVRWMDEDLKTPAAVAQWQKEKERTEPPISARLDADVAFVRGKRTAPAFAHWRSLLEPLVLKGYEPPGTPAWRQVIDERIPVMSFVSLTGAAKSPEGTEDSQAQRDDLWTVKRGDWIRLCYADEADGDPLPYSPSFVQDFEKDACYDRFFPSAATDSSVRYLIAGFHFAVVGAGEKYFDKIIVHHFRRHYFQMGLMLHMEFAALLATSSRITRAVSDLAAGEREGPLRAENAKRKFRETIIEIEQEFLQFQHLYHFTGMSNQIQANELFQKWRGALGTLRIVDDLRAEIRAAAEFALSLEQREETAASNHLAAVATIGVVLGLAFAFLGMNVLIDKELLGLAPPAPGPLAALLDWAQPPQAPARSPLWLHGGWIAFVVSVFCLGGLVAGALLTPVNPEGTVRRRTRYLLWGIAGVASVLCVLFLAISRTPVT